MKVISKERPKSYKKRFGYYFDWGTKNVSDKKANDELQYVLNYHRVPNEASVERKVDFHGNVQYIWTWYETLLDE